ncbi:hypothetical protein J8F10_36125 [Gemmata sp. G18]|uniref:DUF3106 domain-containing protein n=1 Tax=Gemmata palustris TaxID=2822762 RepID=A0ABS5C3X0_9BACT|nr:hypothetical protein [Gemmata palustris]MBP3960684.1 hypothetical protein [Gemmata palustris]
MHALSVRPQKTPEPDEPPRRRWRRWAAAVLLVLGLGGLAWAVRPDPHLARAKELQKELFNSGAKNLSPEQRKALSAEYREQVKRLSADQKWELSAPMREKQKAEMERYFALSPKEKTKYLDERIDRSEKARKEREQKQKAAPGGAAARTGGFGGGPGGKAGAPPGAPGGGPPRSAEEIEKRRKQALERTTPEERARADQFRKEMNDRRRQRGLSVRL